MRWTTGRAELLSSLRLPGIALVLAVVSSAVLAAAAAPAGDASLVVGVLGTLLAACAVARGVAVVLPALTGLGPVVAARDHHRALARRPVPRHRDPDAPGHTRSRAPSELAPAA
ncbi:DUF6412 domain-containing protein [Pseudonocardia kunmingensis]|uniref:Uncharacterized protein n=1 Tax=Pseudonocardia kunmingensis TaxID=630975 RepID=A0A543DYF9_9PSEU|nr:DUF6412 domain-containing protein [Pseudonocardia kunmingensis]TQM14346.1 hypothetical protein FB558_1108 [Pseudonocardia kunmingensis]